MKGRSLNPHPSIRLYGEWLNDFRLYNQSRIFKNQKPVDFNFWDYLFNKPINGNKLVNVKQELKRYD